jgi:uncharacterized membrane protein YkvA (DUF1232 family)
MVPGLERTGPCRCNARLPAGGPARGNSAIERTPRESGPLLAAWKARVRALKREVAALALAMRRPEVPWYAKVLGAAVIAYALSPIDLIPDFIPVLGLLDDLLLVPLGILAVRAMIPPGVLDECRAEAASGVLSSRTRWIAAAIIVLVWASLLVALLRWWLCSGSECSLPVLSPRR